MPYLLPDDLNSHMYAEVRETITRGDASMVNTAIAVGIAYAKMHLSRWNLAALFGTTSGEEYTPPTVEDENLKSQVKAIACWELIKLSNPNIDLKLLRTNYEDAVQFFKDVKTMKGDPEGWAYKEDDPLTPFPEGNVISYTSNVKRNNHY